MSRSNSNGGGVVAIILVVLVLLAILYQCKGADYGLPVLPVDGDTSSSAEADSASSKAEDSSASMEASSESPMAPGGFTYLPATDLMPWTWSNWTIPLPWSTATNTDPGYKANINAANWSPNLCFPLEDDGYANSQVFRPGGTGFVTPEAMVSKATHDALKAKAYSNPKQSGWVTAANTLHGNQCDASNYQYPWRDNFCEKRDPDNAMCHGGKGHQGQDIRPQTCKDSFYWAIAPEDVVIKDVGSYSLTLRGVNSPYRIYRYLHMDPAFIAHWTPLKATTTVVKAGRRLGKVGSFGVGGVSNTTTHLHFEIRLSAAETIDGTLRPATTWVPPYSALVESYKRKLAGNGCPVTAW